MADDTRQQPREDLSKEALNIHPENKPFSGSQWKDPKAKPYKPPENANMMAGGTEHTAGGKMPDVSLSNAFDGGLKWKDFTELPQKPCVRNSLMQGITAGFAVGALRVILRTPVPKASNWAVGSALLTSGVMYQYCMYKRNTEKEGMMRAVEILNKKELEKKAKEQQKEKAKEERRRLKDIEQDEKLAAMKAGGEGGKPWWKVW